MNFSFEGARLRFLHRIQKIINVLPGIGRLKADEHDELAAAYTPGAVEPKGGVVLGQLRSGKTLEKRSVL